jgi:hypothetical protein
MNTPFQHFIDLASKVLDAVNSEESFIFPYEGIGYLSTKSVKFDAYPFTCNVLFIKHERFATSVDISFAGLLDADFDKFDDLFIQWTQNVEDFLASDSPLLLDNQIKADLKK